ncbi:OPT/YSL family transporter [bacterium]|nr:OPT/YSL family transporter [bacterium]
MEVKSPSELTLRAVLSGLFVGCLIGASNVTIGLKIGWTFGAGITAAVISFALFSTMKGMKRPFDSKENLIAATAGSSSGTMASAGGFVAAIPALEMIRADQGLGPLPFISLVIWGMSVAFLGVHFAVPLRRQMIVTEKLRYPTGTATAETIKAMYASGVEAMKKTKILLWTGIGAAALKLLYLAFPDSIGLVEDLSFNDFGLGMIAILGVPIYQLQIGFNLSPMMLGAGVLIGPKVGWSLLAGSILAWGILTPILLNNGTVEVAPNVGAVSSALVHVQEKPDSDRAQRHLDSEIGDAIHRAERIASHRSGVTAIDVLRHYEAPAELLRAAGMQPADEAKPVPAITKAPDTTSPYRAGFNWVLWTGVALMITSSFTSLAMQWKTIARTFTSMRAATKRPGDENGEDEEEPDAPDPYPMKFWVIGMTLATAFTVTLAKIYFGIPIWEGLLAIFLSLFIAAIAVRATGETDINPVGAMGKITQVVYGALAPGKMVTNLMAAAITSAGASQAGDLMQDMKAGYMLKVSIRRQVLTQLLGVIVGVFAAAATFRVLTIVYEIPGHEFPGPAVFAWYKMAEILAVGLSALPAGALWGAAVGGGLGILLPLGSRFLPKSVSKWIPSPVAFGIAFMVPAVYSIGMWLGALLTQIYNKKHPVRVDKYGASLASGFIAGEGLMMVAFALYLMATQFLF